MYIGMVSNSIHSDTYLKSHLLRMILPGGHNSEDGTRNINNLTGGASVEGSCEYLDLSP